jgi:hypothetical protein
VREDLNGMMEVKLFIMMFLKRLIVIIVIRKFIVLKILLDMKDYARDVFLK